MTLMDTEEVSPKKRKPKWWGVLTVVGALIAFTSFIVNEYINESLKDKAAAIENARTKYDILTAIGKVELRTDQIARASTSGSDHMYKLNEDIISLTRGELDEISDLLTKAPDESDSTKADNLKTDLDDAADNAHRNEPSDSASLEQDDAASKATDALIHLSGEVSDLHQQVITDAQNSYAETQKQYKLWTAVVWVLYVLGWIISLVSSFAGAPEVEPA